jgi:drug/metabolite transporter (DMT)-like permease
MTQFVALFLIGIMYGFSAWLTYKESNRNSSWFIPALLAIGTVVNLVWAGMARYLDNKQKIYIFSLLWDTVMVLVWYFIPILFFGVKIDRWILLGVLLMVLGLSIIKVRS